LLFLTLSLIEKSNGKNKKNPEAWAKKLREKWINRMEKC